MGNPLAKWFGGKKVEKDEAPVATVAMGAQPIVVPEPPKVAASTLPLKLDLGCGQHPREGFEGVDLNAPDAKHKVDLFKFPWPWKDNSVDEIHASHFVEHIPARDVELLDMVRLNDRPAIEKFVGQDMLFAFFDECYRILKHDAPMTVIVPALRTSRAFQDPTHRRFIPQELFAYLSAEHRKAMGLSHYRVRCNFAGNVNPSISMDMHAKHPDVQAQAFRHYWDAVIDLHAVMKAIKET